MANKIASTNYTKDTLQLFRSHPGLALIASYFFLTLIGVTYYYYYYDAFDVPILKLVDFSDIIIAGIREPMIIVMFLVTLALTGCYDWMFRTSARLHKRLERQKKTVWNKARYYLLYMPKSNITVYGFITFFLIYVLLFMIQILADHRVENIKQESTNTMLLQVGDNPDSRSVVLLGSTTNYLIFYDPGLKRAEVINVENINALSPNTEKVSEPKT
ncbi:hypothetical protein FLL45_16170 [Aliikangiella marina]|uniref:Uncharacterized protein n=1 Tax=Aliikangiella marina TaxID=1712262 RepID=A0A545T6Z6_9GAMM|nr:hypothetical protein [Aliikangiella marina]TQV72997.1 hypothetical protein FLL45_16170 [Aliikangiella marina]